MYNIYNIVRHKFYSKKNEHYSKYSCTWMQSILVLWKLISIIFRWYICTGDRRILCKKTKNAESVNVKMRAMWCMGLIWSVFIKIKCFVDRATIYASPESKARWAHVGPTWSRQDPRWAKMGPTKFAVGVAKELQIEARFCHEIICNVRHDFFRYDWLSRF